MSQADCTHQFKDLYGESHWHCIECPARGNFTMEFEVSKDKPQSFLHLLWDLICLKG